MEHIMWLALRNRTFFGIRVLRMIAAIPVLVGATYMVIRWFTAGLIASKWIGLPQLAAAREALLQESTYWGLGALAVQFIGAWLLMPRREQKEDLSSAPITYSSSRTYAQNPAIRYALGFVTSILGTLACCLVLVLVVVVFRVRWPPS